MKIKTIVQIIVVVLILYPLVLILIPNMFGYYLYGPLNGAWVYYSWIILGFLFWITGAWYTYSKETRIYVAMFVFIAGSYLWLDAFGRSAANMRRVTPEERLTQLRRIEDRRNLEPMEYECLITTFNSAPVGGGGISVLRSYGGGTFVDSNIPGYKRRPNDEESVKISECSWSRRITPGDRREEESE